MCTRQREEREIGRGTVAYTQLARCVYPVREIERERGEGGRDSSDSCDLNTQQKAHYRP